MRKIFILFVLMMLPSIVIAGWQISGKIIGADGKVPVLAHVNLLDFKGNYREPFQTMIVGKYGQFRIEVSNQGLYRLFVTAVGHHYCSIPLIVDTETPDINLNIQLALLEYKNQFDSVKIIGDWNNFNFNDAEIMEKQADGTFVYKRLVNANTIGYQLIGLTSELRSVNGTQSDYYVYDGGGDYRSALRVKPGVVKITFDPSKLVRIEAKDLPLVKFDNQNSLLQKVWEIEREANKERYAFQAAVLAYQKTEKDLKYFRYDWSALVELLTDKMNNEKQLAVRQFAAIQLGQLIPMRAKLDSTLQSQILELVPANSPMWAALPQLPMMIRQDERKIQAFMEALSEQNPDRVVRAIALSQLTMMAQVKGNEAAFKRYYEKLKTDYSDVKEIQFDLKRLNPEKRIAVGKPVPDFEITLLNGKQKVSNKSLLGKFYLMDFWATWCGPCVAEMENLHKAYEKFKGKNFIILSLSLDRKIEDIAKFRAEKWKMPWLHAFLYDEANKKVIETFEVMAIPKPILVGFDGRIIATEVSLRGEQLEKTLTDFLE